MNRDSFYTVGGTISPGAPSYVARQADDNLLQLCDQGAFVYIMAPGQMGKSSLIARTVERLAERRTRSAVIDLSLIGIHVTAEQWYLGLIHLIRDRLEIEIDLKRWWDEHASFSLLQRLNNFFEEVLLTQTRNKVVIFLDEFDIITQLNFANDFLNDFLAYLRASYNMRAVNTELRRLSFVLSGAITPDSMPHGAGSPFFNILQRIELTDFTYEEALPLAAGLGLPPAESERVLEWVLVWTAGHPYLTQRLCQIISNRNETSWIISHFEKVVVESFLGENGATDPNLAYVTDVLTRSARSSTVLKVYERILHGQSVGDSQDLSYLLSCGVVRRTTRDVGVRNRIYREYFNDNWLASRTSLIKPLDDLTADDREAALSILSHFITTQGARVAQAINDLAALSNLPRRKILSVLNSLRRDAIIREVLGLSGEQLRNSYEIVSDQLAEQIQQWLAANGRTPAPPQETASSDSVGHYLFYLSYARSDYNRSLTEFYRDLCDAIRVLTGESKDQIGFFNSDQIQAGEEWSEITASALQSSRVLIGLLSPAYFQSEMCGKEWQVFTLRAEAGMSDAGRAKEGRPPAIMPVLWSSPDQLPDLLPNPAAGIQFTHERLGRIYANEGLRRLIGGTGQYRKQYAEFVDQLAKEVVDVAHSYALPPLVERPSLANIESAFQNPIPSEVHAPDNESDAVPSAGPPTGRWVLVAGTGVGELPEQVNRVSREVGKALAQRGYGLIVGGWSGVDYVVTEAFDAELTAEGCDPADRLIQAVPVDTQPVFSGGRIIQVQEGEEGFTEKVKRADAVILIGGLGSTYTVYEFARRLQKPVFPIASTGTDARKAFTEILADWATQAPQGINQEEFLKLKQSSNTEEDAGQLAKDVLDLIDSLWVRTGKPLSLAEALARIVFVEGSLLDQSADALVHSVGTDPMRGGAVGVDLVNRLGPGFLESSNVQKSLGPGDTLVSKTDGRLPARYVIHTCSETLSGVHTLVSNMQAITGALNEADRLHLQTVALPAIGTGAAGFEAHEVAPRAIEAVVSYLEEGSGLEKIIFAFIDETIYRNFLSAFQQMGGPLGVRVLLPRLSISSRHALRLAEALRIRLGKQRISTSLFLWGLYQKQGGAARELLTAIASQEEVEAGLQERVGIKEPVDDLEPVPASALAHIRVTPRCEEALIKAFELASNAEVIRERQMLAGLLGVPSCRGVKWLSGLSGLSPEQLWNIVAVHGEDEGEPIGPQIRSLTSVRTEVWRLTLSEPQVKGSNVAELRVGERITLTLDLEPTMPTNDERERQLILSVPENALELTGFIKARGFHLQGDNVFTIPVANGRPTKRSFAFELVPLLSGQRIVEVEVYPGGRVAGLLPSTVTRTLRVASPVALPDIKELIDRRRVPNPQPDVMLYVALEETAEGQQTRLYLTCHRLRLDREPLEALPLNESDLAAMRRAAIRAAVGATHASPQDVLTALRACGAMLFDRLVSGAFQEYYYNISHLAALTPAPWSWLIISDENAMLPWELVCYYGVDPKTGTLWYDDFLADKFLVSHWVGQLGLRLLIEAPVGQVDLVHYDQHPRELPRWRTALGGEEYVEVEETPGQLSLLQPGSYCYGLHLLRYTEQRRSNQIVAADGDGDARPGERNEAEDMTFEQRLDLTLRRPTVGLSFINTLGLDCACGFAQLDMHLEANWMMPLMHAGASALVGPRWPVSAEADQLFAEEFYKAMREGESLGLAVRRARRQVRAAFPHRPDWLAYTHFGHPQCEPYPVRPSQGFALFEAIDQPDDRPFLAGAPYLFRASYRTEAPAWYRGRLRMQQGGLPDEPLSVMVMPLTGVLPETYMLEPVSQSNDLQCTVELTMPERATTLPVVVRFQKGSEELRTIMLNLQVKGGV